MVASQESPEWQRPNQTGKEEVQGNRSNAGSQTPFKNIQLNIFKQTKKDIVSIKKKKKKKEKPGTFKEQEVLENKD